MKELVALAAIAATLAAPASAAVFDFSYTGTGVAASGQLITTDTMNANGYFTVLDIAGTRNGAMITLLPPRAFLGNDNLFSLTSPFFTLLGLSFASAGQNYNLYFTGGACPNRLVEATSSDCAPAIDIQFSASRADAAVPEPATWAMMIGGFGLVGGAMRARRARGTAAA